MKLFVILIISIHLAHAANVTNSFHILDFFKSNLPPVGTFNKFNYIASFIKAKIVFDDIKTLFKEESNECTRQIELWIQSALKLDEWAIRMLDASAKFQSGILTGNIMHLGDTEECLDINEIVENEEIKGKYCNIRFIYPQIFKQNIFKDIQNIQNSKYLFWKSAIGICIPSQCSTEYLEGLFIKIIYKFDLPFEIEVDMDESYCISNDKSAPMTTITIITLAILALLLVVILISTINHWMYYDINLEKEEELNYYLAFSFIQNTQKVFAAKLESNINSMNGIKVLSMIFIVLGHHYMYSFSLACMNSFKIPDFGKRLDTTYLLVPSFFAVDTFLTLSGLLIVYLGLNHVEPTFKFALKFYFNRFVRLSPSYIFLIMVSMSSFVQYFGNGPISHLNTERLIEHCDKYWWSALLFLQNYVNPTEICAAHTWYLSVDTQLYMISPLFLIGFKKWPRKTVCVTALLMLGSSYFALIQSIKYKLMKNQFFSQDEFVYIYIPTHIRCTSWLVGLLAGYFFYIYKNQKIALNHHLRLALQLASYCTIFLLPLSFYFLLNQDEELLVIKAISYTTGRPIWSLAICTIIFLSNNDKEGALNKFLSNYIFQILVRINYNLYLCHSLVIGIYQLSIRHPIYISNLSLLHGFWGNLLYSFIIAFLLTVTIEYPFVNLLKILQRKNDLRIGNKIGGESKLIKIQMSDGKYVKKSMQD